MTAAGRGDVGQVKAQQVEVHWEEVLHLATAEA
jgi:hypothetical protein